MICNFILAFEFIAVFLLVVLFLGKGDKKNDKD